MHKRPRHLLLFRRPVLPPRRFPQERRLRARFVPATRSPAREEDLSFSLLLTLAALTWYRENRERHLQKNREWYLRNRERVLEKLRERWQSDPEYRERQLQKWRRYRQRRIEREGREWEREKAKRYWERHKEVIQKRRKLKRLKRRLLASQIARMPIRVPAHRKVRFKPCPELRNF